MSDLEIFPEPMRLFSATPHQTLYYKNLTARLHEASTSIRVCQYVFAISPTRHWQRSNKLLTTLFDAAKRGVELKILFDRPKLRSPNFHSNAASAKVIQSTGVPVRCLSVVKTLHLKLIIIDARLFFAGSHNLTNSSLYSPFELSWECQDPFMVNSAIIYFDCLYNGNLSEPFDDALKQVTHGPSH